MMKILRFILIVSALLMLNTNQSTAQTQDEIERLLNGGNTTTTEENNTKKKDKEAKQKDKKETEVKKEKTTKVKEEKTVEVTVKEEPKTKDEKTVKVKEVKVKEEKTAKVKEEKPTRARPSASADKPLRSWSIGVFGGLTHPLTDIRYKDWFGTIDPVNENQWNAGLRITKMFDAAIGIQWQGSYNVVQGAFDKYVEHEQDRDYLIDAGFTEGVYFKSNVIATSFNIYWNISNTVFGPNRYYRAKMKGRTIKPRRFSLYMYTGLGATWFDPHVMMIADKRPIDLLNVDIVNKNEDETIMEMNIPIALGTKFKLGKAVDLSIEYVVNYLFTDKLDGFVYNHPGRVKNDLYTNLNLGLDFKIGTKKKSKEHVEWVNPMENVYDGLSKIDDLNRKFKRLTTDKDDDGVSDWFDKDTETEEGMLVDGSGRAIDSDGDGIADKYDVEPFSDKDAEVDEYGKALDSDGDGVPNHKDIEPNTKKGEFVNFQGKAIKGVVKPAVARGVFFPSIFFDTDKATIKREYEDELFMIAKDMLAMEGANFLLTGHCDERGSEEYNIELGKRRAEAVKQYLVENYGIDANRIETLSKGKSGIDAPRFKINRRVDVMIIEK